MSIQKIISEQPKIPELIMKSLIEAIRDGSIKVGEEVPSERDLADVLGVGRGSLRECLSILEFVGAVETRGNRKILLRDADYIEKVGVLFDIVSVKNSWKTLNEFRRIIEVGAVELACQNATAEDLMKIETAAKKLKEAPNKYEYDVEFHNAIALASHNAILASSQFLASSLIADFRSKFWDIPEYEERATNSHFSLLKAIKSRDVARAQLEMILHLEIVSDFANEYPNRTD